MISPRTCPAPTEGSCLGRGLDFCDPVCVDGSRRCDNDEQADQIGEADLCLGLLRCVEQRTSCGIHAFVLCSLGGLPEEAIGRDSGAKDGDDRDNVVLLPDQFDEAVLSRT
jgi:hypothetical protein